MRLKTAENLHQTRHLQFSTKTPESKSSKTFTTLVTSLVNWFSEAARPLPWRKTPANPYEIWISEIMSQQSTIKMMLPFYENWMKKFPSLEVLAKASEESVMKSWEGLGYYSRARNLHKASKLLLKDFPQDPDELIKIPGIGPYTAAAISAIAFDYPIVPIDGNVTRVFSRFFGVKNPLGSKEDAKRIQNLALEVAQKVPTSQRSAFAQSVMELGALICKPASQAKCFECPLSRQCEAKRQKSVELWPVPKLRPELQQVARLLLLYRNEEGALLFRKRPSHLSLSDQWEIPYFDIKGQAKEIKGLFGPSFEMLNPIKHTIMSAQYTVWPLVLGRWKGALPEGHVFADGAFKGVVTTLTRKFMAKPLKRQSLKKAVD